MLLIDEMKAHLPITAYASRHLSKALIANGFDVTPEKELKILNAVESGEEGGIACLLDTPENFVVSLSLLRVRPDHPLHDKIMTYAHYFLSVILL